MDINVNQLNTLDELESKMVRLIGKDSIKKMTEDNLIPHYRLHNPATNEYIILYKNSEVNEWIKSNLLKINSGDDLKPVRFVYFDESLKMSFSNMNDVPLELSNIKHLYEVPNGYIDTISGIYFLVESNKIVYIGQSVDVLTRVKTHVSENCKQFSRAFFVKVPRDKLSYTEASLINHIKPKYNLTSFKNIIDVDFARKVLCHEMI